MGDEADYLSYFIIFHRRLGCSDESSTDDEQKERILYFYPPDISVFAQLSKLSMVEGLIEFTNKFSSETVEYITMADDTWAFLQCEEDTWIVAAVKNDCKLRRNSLLFRHRPNGCALLTCLKHVHRLYVTFHGDLGQFLIGKSGMGWSTIGEVQQLKKRIRKLGLRMQQERQDLDSASREPEDCDRESFNEDSPPLPPHVKDEVKIAQFAALIDISRSEIADAQSQLDSTLASGSYTPSQLSEQIARFMSWYLSSGEFYSPGVFHSLKGQKISVLSAAMAPIVLRIRHAVQESSGGLCSKCMLICDGGTVWSDLEDDTSWAVSEFLRIQEMKATRESYSILMTLSAAGVDFVAPASGPVDPTILRSISVEGGQGMSLKNIVRRMSTIMSRKSDQAISAEKWQKQEEDWGRYVLSRKGFISEGWNVLDASTLGFPPDVPASSNGSPHRKIGVEEAFDDTRDIDIVSSQCEKALGIWCPSIYACPSSCDPQLPYFARDITTSACETVGSVTRLGRILVIRYGKLLLVMLFEDWGADEENLPKVSQYPVRSSPVEGEERSFGVRLATLISVVQQQLTADFAELDALFNSRLPAGSTTLDSARTTICPSENVKILSYNTEGQFLQEIGFPDTETCHVSTWPSPLGSRRRPEGGPRSPTTAKGRTESIDDVERVVSDRIMHAIVPKFSLPPSFQASLVDPVLMNSLNDFVNCFRCSSQQTDICVRLGSAHRGGIWAVARRFGGREVYILVEGCNTLVLLITF